MKPDDIEKGFAELRAENAELRSKIAALEERGGRKVLPPPPLPEEGARVFYPVQPSTFVMPNDDELNRLQEIVCRKYPQLGDTGGPAFYGSKEERRADWFKQFNAAFLALGNMHRTKTPDHKRYASHWTEEAEIWLRSHGKPAPTLRFGPFVAAVLAHGDIRYSGLFVDGHVLELGLNTYVGRAASDAWKKVLETQKLLPMSLAHLPMAPPSPVRVIVGDHSAW
jgi:hypothetical protein